MLLDPSDTSRIADPMDKISKPCYDQLALMRQVNASMCDACV